MGATTLTIYSESGDGYLAYAYSDDYNEARDATTATGKYTATNYLIAGWDVSVPALFRSFLYFDTSSIPTTAVISSATVEVYLAGTYTIVSGGHKIYLMNGQPTYPSASLDVADFSKALYSTGGANYITCLNGQYGYYTFTLNSVGRGWIYTGPGATTKLGLFSGFDIVQTIPFDNMWLWFYSAEKGTTYRPKLVVSYITVPSVTTNAATSIGSTYATGNGEMADPGSESITEYGFIYNDDGSDPVDIASADVKEISTNMSGNVFSAAFSGLTPGTTYLYRAYVTNGAGTGYGDAVEFTTGTAPDVLSVTTNLATSVEAETATFNANIDSTGEYQVTQHGFIWKDGGDPYEPGEGPISSPTGAEHYVQLGTGTTGSYNYSTTGLDENSTYMIRGYATNSGGTDYGEPVVARTGERVTETFYGMAGDGTIMAEYYSLISYADANSHVVSATSGDSMDTGSSTEYVYYIQTRAGAYYLARLWNMYLYFDTSSIPNDAIIEDASLQVYVINDPEDKTVNLLVYNGQPNYPTSSGITPALALGDYQKSKYTYIGYSISLTNLPGYNEIANTTDIITKGGLTKFMIYPSGLSDEYGTIIYSGNNGTNKPKLEITYFIAPSTITIPQISIGDEWKIGGSASISIGDEWRAVSDINIGISDEWKLT